MVGVHAPLDRHQLVIFLLRIVILVPQKIQRGSASRVGLPGVTSPQDPTILGANDSILAACFNIVTSLIIVFQLGNSRLCFVEAIDDTTHRGNITPTMRSVP